VLDKLRHFHDHGNVKKTDALAALAALAQESRLDVFRLLVRAGPEGRAANEIAATLGLAPATLSFHLKELSRAGLIVPRPESRFIYYSANYDRMNGLLGYLTENCCKVGECEFDNRAGSCTPGRRKTARSEA
jgi:ArsR family transcriptional regulator